MNDETKSFHGQKNIAITDLKEAEYNPRQISKDDFQQLCRSIKEFGFAEPLVVNQHPSRMNVVIGGHQRLKAARVLGYTKLPCYLLNLPEEKERELNVRLNRNTGEFDFDILANNFDLEDLLDWGMTARELDLSGVMGGDDVETTGGGMDTVEKPKVYDYKIIFNNETEQNTFYNWLAELKVAYPNEDFPTLSQKMLAFFNDHPIQA